MRVELELPDGACVGCPVVGEAESVYKELQFEEAVNASEAWLICRKYWIDFWKPHARRNVQVLVKGNHEVARGELARDRPRTICREITSERIRCRVEIEKALLGFD